MLTSTITIKGQVTLPVNLRKQLGVKPSDKIAFIKKGQQVFLEKLPSLGSLYGSLFNSKVRALSVQQMNKLIDQGLFPKT